MYGARSTPGKALQELRPEKGDLFCAGAGKFFIGGSVLPAGILILDWSALLLWWQLFDRACWPVRNLVKDALLKIASATSCGRWPESHRNSSDSAIQRSIMRIIVGRSWMLEDRPRPHHPVRNGGPIRAFGFGRNAQGNEDSAAMAAQRPVRR